jgi:hypothetical protein
LLLAIVIAVISDKAYVDDRDLRTDEHSKRVHTLEVVKPGICSTSLET